MGVDGTRYGNLRTMPTDALDARVLLEVAPDQYVTERTRLVKQARADRDKERASFFQALKRPSVALWAALVAGDSDIVHKILTVTSELGKVQAGGSNSTAVAAATKNRRTTLEGFVDRAVNALAMFDAGAEKRRPEIRALVDQLSRNPELADAWIDGTLREIPDEQFGFGAFDGVQLTQRDDGEPPAKSSKPAKKSAKSSKRDEPAPREEVRDLAAERAARAKLRDQVRDAKKEIAEAARELTAADRKVTVARAAVKDAERELKVAEDRRAAAERDHERAVAYHDSLH
jgi:hypothetical protein